MTGKKALTKIFMPGPLRESHRIAILLKAEEALQDLDARTSQEHPRTAFKQAPQKRQGIFQIFIARTSKTWHSQDLHARTSWRFSAGSSQDFLIRTCRQVMQGHQRGFHQNLYNIFSQGPLQDLGQDHQIY